MSGSFHLAYSFGGFDSLGFDNPDPGTEAQIEPEVELGVDPGYYYQDQTGAQQYFYYPQ